MLSLNSLPIEIVIYQIFPNFDFVFSDEVDTDAFFGFGYFKEDKTRKIFWLFKSVTMVYLDFKFLFKFTEVENLNILFKDNPTRSSNPFSNFDKTCFKNVKKLTLDSKRYIVEADTDSFMKYFSLPKLEKLFICCFFISSSFTGEGWNKENLKKLKDVKLENCEVYLIFGNFRSNELFAQYSRSVDFYLIDESLRKNRSFFLKLVKNDYFFFQCENEFKKDKEIALEAVKQNGDSFKYVDESLKKDKKFVLEAVKQNGDSFQYADYSFKKDKKIVLTAVKQNGKLLCYADTKLKKDKKIVLAAVNQNGVALKFADKSLKKDKKFVLELVKESGNSLRYVHKSLKKKKEIVLEAVKQNGDSLQYADDSLKKNKEIVLAAVKQNGDSLQHAYKPLKKDKEIVLAAVKNSGTSLRLADKSMKKDKEIVIAAVKQNAFALKYADESLKCSKK